MDRRYFMTLLSSGLLVPQVLRGEHHIISMAPLEMEFDLWSLQGQYTSVEDFYVRDHFAVPPHPETPTIKIEGEVATPRELAVADLTPLGQRKLGAVLECAGNRVGATGLVSNGAWAGWPLKDVLLLARPTGAAAYLHLFGRDGYKRSIPWERALADGILVTHLNSRPLTLQHGAPWRVVVAGWYGMDSVKWLERMVVATAPLPPEGGTYQQSRTTASGDVDRQELPRVQVKSVIIDPQKGAVLRRGKVDVRGLAWTGEGSVESVEVSPDGGGTWQSAVLDHSADLEWVAWKASLDFTQAGPVELVARARDSKGQMQPAERDQSRLDGYTNNWYHRVSCVVV
jgi:DMSO/TMAO reductase YedYZ molybdopterin-dependent catalytic subunit